MTFQAKLAITGVVGLALIALIAMAGCGEVELMPMPDAGSDTLALPPGHAGSGAAGSGGIGGAAGTSTAGTIGHAGSGAAGTLGAGGTGVAGTGAAGEGFNARPLGAGCTEDLQCGSKICAKAHPNDAGGMCCDGRPGECSVCSGGYVTPAHEGEACGAAEACDGTDRKSAACRAGACAPKVVQCAKALCDKQGKPIVTCVIGGCDLGNDPCYCKDAMGGGYVSYPCAP